MTELSNSQYYLKGGNSAAKIFVSKWLEKIDLWSLADRWFREYYRSGNIFTYRFDGDFTKDDKKKFNQVFGSEPIPELDPYTNETSEIGKLETTKQIPLRYIILNPADVRASENITFSSLTYFKVLTNYELIRLRNPQTPEDLAVINNLGTEAMKQIREGAIPLLPLNIKHLTMSFYKKQDYEPFAVPFGYPVLEDIDVKLEFKKMDAALGRTIEHAILLITMGESPKDGGIGMNPAAIQNIKGLFESSSLKKVLVADWTTKAEWQIPDLNKVLGTFKYEQLDKDIREGLNMIITGEDKFANSQTKVEIFVERLKSGRKAFLTFLMTEVRRVCKNMGFKNYPEVLFEEINLKNEIEFAKLYTQLASIGYLTPNETLDAIQTGQLPTPDELNEAQLQFKKDKANGLFVPQVGGGTGGAQGNDPSSPGGRPTGTKKKKSKVTVTPQGKKSKASYSMSTLKDLISLSNRVEGKLNEAIKKKYKLKELDETQLNMATTILTSILTNEKPEDWENSIKEYAKEPKEINLSIASEMDEIIAEHDVNPNLAALLYHSKKE